MTYSSDDNINNEVLSKSEQLEFTEVDTNSEKKLHEKINKVNSKVGQVNLFDDIPPLPIEQIIEKKKYEPRKKSEGNNNVKSSPDPKLRSSYLQSNRDLPLKVLVSKVFSFMGYTTFLETNIIAYNYGKSFRKEMISDIDVFALRFEQDLRRTSIIVECKSGETNALEHLLKLDGICRLRNANQGALIQTRIPTNAREVGSSLGHITWDQSDLIIMLKSFGIWQANLENELIDLYIEKAEIQKQIIKDFPKLGKFLSVDYWLSPDYRNIQSIISGLVQTKDKISNENTQNLYLLDQSLLLFSTACLKASHSIIQNYLSSPVERLKDFLFGGARERRDREILFDKVNQHIGEKTPFLPIYFDSFAELVIRYVNSPDSSCKIPYIWSTIIDLRLSNSSKLPEYLSTCDVISLKLIKDTLRFISKTINHTPKHWDAFIHI